MKRVDHKLFQLFFRNTNIIIIIFNIQQHQKIFNKKFEIIFMIIEFIFLKEEGVGTD